MEIIEKEEKTKSPIKVKKVLAALSALAQESRLAIFRLLMEKGDQGISAGDIAKALHIPATTLSFHLSQLSSAGLVKSHKQGRSIIYVANRKRMKRVANYLLRRLGPLSPIAPEDFLSE